MDDLVTAISKDIESEGAKVEKIDNMGRKDFAHAPRKIEGAHYVTYTLSGEPECISRIRAKLSLNNSVYLNQFNRVA
ncbi:MAG: 30S ribosomal protein S6 [Akkermansiaceae bacterium]|jgi:small subunit ribosomal protein S6|nr:30S ribosomal protein S6 [Akkermansiaceae bacterium]